MSWRADTRIWERMNNSFLSVSILFFKKKTNKKIKKKKKDKSKNDLIYLLEEEIKKWLWLLLHQLIIE